MSKKLMQDSCTHLKLEKTLKNAVKFKYNVLLEGNHGTGKTTIIKEILDKKFGKDGWVYFSGSTMDPFVDFIGCPKEINHEDYGSVLELIKPTRFAGDTVKAIFIDEFNRSPKEVRNAIMELIQFKSINGKKYNNLEMVWAAINPSEDDEYDVEEIDPAQLDRFQIKLKITDKLNRKYFKDKYGESVANGAIEWWNGLESEQKKQISSRRLDYALEAKLVNSLDITTILPYKNIKIKDLLKKIETNTSLEELLKLDIEKDEDKIKDFFKDENKYLDTKEFVKENVAVYMPLWPEEKFVAELSSESNSEFLVQFFNSKHSNKVLEILKEIKKANIDTKLIEVLDRDDVINTLEIQSEFEKIKLDNSEDYNF